MRRPGKGNTLMRRPGRGNIPMHRLRSAAVTVDDAAECGYARWQYLDLRCKIVRPHGGMFRENRIRG